MAAKGRLNAGERRRGFTRRIVGKVTKLPPEQVEKLFADLTGELELAAAFFDSVPTGLVICDREGRVQGRNRAAERLLPFVTTETHRGAAGCREGGDDASCLPLWRLVEDGDVAAFLQSLWEKNVSNKGADFVLARPEGGARFLRVEVLPWVQNKRIAGQFVRLTDATAEHNRAVLLRRMENLEGLTTLAANVAHEIKNPLGGISIHIQLMERALAAARKGSGQLPDAAHLEHYLDIVTGEIERLNKIVVDFLFAVRPVQADLTPQNPAPILEEVARFFAPELERRGIALKTAIPLEGDTPTVMLDDKLLRQVLLNLLKNALESFDYPHPDGPPLEAPPPILLTLPLDGDLCRITVADNGSGMDTPTLTHIFEPYYTTKPTGTGLGLTMSYKIIRDLLGDINVTSEPGKGTAFVLTFPVIQSQVRSLEGPA
jgi:signal transduction histidine kinase